MEDLYLGDIYPYNDDVAASKSYSSYRSAVTALSSSTPAVEHPLLPPSSTVTTAEVSDPLILTPRGSRSPLESASYADVISSSFHDGFSESNVNGMLEEESTVSPRSQSSSSEYLKITVSSPQKEVESSNSIVPGGNTYVTYLITTKTDILDYRGSDFSVRRRFKDVVTLSDRLSDGYRGLFIPPRPDKSLVESQVMQKQEFVEQRRAELEKYLKRLARHPVIGKCDELRVFLTVQGKLPLPTSIDVASRVLDGAVRLPKQLLGESTSVIEPEEVVQPAKNGKDLLRFLKELKQSVTNDWGNSRSPLEVDDKEFLEKKGKLLELEQQLSNTSKQAELLVKGQQDIGDTMGELGLTLIKLTKFESEHTELNTQKTRAADIKNVATTAVKSSRLYRELNLQVVKHLETLQEYMGLMFAVHNAFSDRSNALLTLQTLVSELHSLRLRTEKASSKLFGSDKSRIRKFQELNNAIKVTDDAKSCAIREYERIKIGSLQENNRSEIQRLDEERQADFIKMLTGFVTTQVAYTEKIANEWVKVADQTTMYAKKRM
ncbi:sorting nexin 2B-like isoform X1 [Primulina huaijiensis]|uniref:sorting nexin 2B-like isoform X1 n=1 Tax=Primulina huaijiensis TaxID=1492673 RepID=UPI003CC6F8FB